MLIVNLFGGPGSGKTSAASAVYAALKTQGKKVGFAREVAYDMIVAGRAHMLQDQIWMFAKQRRYMLDVIKDNDLVITDCPLLLSLIYGGQESQSFQNVVVEEHKKHNNLNIFLNRPKTGFSEYGRVHNYEQSVGFDMKMKEMLVYHNQPFTIVDVDLKTTGTILSILNSGM